VGRLFFAYFSEQLPVFLEVVFPEFNDPFDKIFHKDIAISG
jgi:uncharacterized membrane protein